jgi:hypothetical protein
VDGIEGAAEFLGSPMNVDPVSTLVSGVRRTTRVSNYRYSRET